MLFTQVIEGHHEIKKDWFQETNILQILRANTLQKMWN